MEAGFLSIARTLTACFLLFDSFFSIGRLFGLQTHIKGNAASRELSRVSHQDQFIRASLGLTDLDLLSDLSAKIVGHIKGHFTHRLVVAHQSQSVQISGECVLACDRESTEHGEHSLFFHFNHRLRSIDVYDFRVEVVFALVPSHEHFFVFV